MTTKTRPRKGKGLERITKSLGSKVPIQIAEGMIRQRSLCRQQSLLLSVDSLQEAIYRFFLTSSYTKNASLLENYTRKVDVSYLLHS